MTSYAERLAQMDETYESADPKTGSSLVPDGDYEGLIERFDFYDPASKGKEGGLKLITEISVLDEGYEGQNAPTVWHDLEDPDRIGWVKGYLEMLGLAGIKLSELEDRLEPLAGTTKVAIRVVTKGEFRNTYVNEVIGEPGGADLTPAATGAGGGGDDDIPF